MKQLPYHQFIVHNGDPNPARGERMVTIDDENVAVIVRKPESDARHLYAGHRPLNTQTLSELFPGYELGPGFNTISFILRYVNNGLGLFVFLIHTCQVNSAFSSTFKTVTLNDRCMKWFEACLRRAFLQLSQSFQ